MGLYVLVANPVEWERLYNCSFYSVDSVPMEERKKILFSVVVFVLFIAYEVMIEMAIFDMLSLPLTAFVPAIYTYNGFMYCSAPKISFVLGSFMFALWIGYSTTSLILALNRCLAITNNYDRVFGDKWLQILWLTVAPAASIGVLLFGQSANFNSRMGAWFFNPHLSYYDDPEGKYNSDLQFFNNIVFCSFLPAIYALFFWRYRGYLKTGERGMSKTEIQLLTQTCIINVTIALAAAGYMIMQYLPVPRYCIAFSHVGWIIVEGAPPVVYLTMNKAIRGILFGERSTSGVRPAQLQTPDPSGKNPSENRTTDAVTVSAVSAEHNPSST